MIIENLNHACIKISFENGTKILFDPWLEGYAFEEGWGLKYNNLSAIEKTKDCNYLWISHFHSDHFHIPTLKKNLQINPDIKVICNDSFNFTFSDVIKGLGFKNIIYFSERVKLQLNSDISITRYPTTGIDNMLHIETKKFNILNYNDCNLPFKAIKKLKNKIGNIDILLNNYNHARKLFEYPLPPDDEIKSNLKVNFRDAISVFEPRYTIPFASFHYYRAPESFDQNNSLLTVDELITIDKSILSLNVGDGVTFNDNGTKFSMNESMPISLNPIDLKVRSQVYTIEELKVASKKFSRKINSGFLRMTFIIPALQIKVIDLNQVISLKISKGELIEIKNTDDWHISVTSSELLTWWSKPYGTDSFVVGGHFELNTNNIFPLKIKLLFGLLTENKLDLKSILLMLVSFRGIKFLLNRREEISGILFSGKFMLGTRK